MRRARPSCQTKDSMHSEQYLRKPTIFRTLEYQLVSPLTYSCVFLCCTLASHRRPVLTLTVSVQVPSCHKHNRNAYSLSSLYLKPQQSRRPEVRQASASLNDASSCKTLSIPNENKKNRRKKVITTTSGVENQQRQIMNWNPQLYALFRRSSKTPNSVN